MVIVLIYVIGPRDKLDLGIKIIDVTTKSKSPFSPMLNGCSNPIKAVRMENAWQFSKVYREHLDVDGRPNSKWYQWSRKGFQCSWSYRYPMGKGAIPEYSFLNGTKLGYIESRKQLYVPLYKSMLENLTKEIDDLVQVCEKEDVALWDYDGYLTSDSFDEILHNPSRKMGHAFVLREVINERIQSSR